MSMPDDKHRRSPADRFRNIISADQGKDEKAAPRRYPKNTVSPGLNLPSPRPAQQHEIQSPGITPVSPTPTTVRPAGRNIMPAFWTAASIISLVFNVVLLILVLGLLRAFGSMDAAGLSSGVLGGLYNNFELMDAAHIKASIPVKTTVPLSLSVPVQTTTAVTLAKDVSIAGAHVRINTALFNIDAPANITLPAGTSLDVAMNFTLPMQSDIPVELRVPVDIPLQKTELHPAIQGLQDTIRPIYCMLSPAAQSLSGEPVCK